MKTSTRLHEQAEAIKQQDTMMAYLVETVGKFVDQRSPEGVPPSAERTRSSQVTAKTSTRTGGVNQAAGHYHGLPRRDRRQAC